MGSIAESLADIAEDAFDRGGHAFGAPIITSLQKIPFRPHPIQPQFHGDGEEEVEAGAQERRANIGLLWGAEIGPKHPAKLLF